MAHTVEDVQRQLKAKGFDPGPVDGKFGMLTQVQLRRFQKSRNLAETGSLNPLTEAALFGTPAKPPSLIGGIFSAIFSKETGMSKYSKLLAAIIGNAVGIVVVWIAVHIPIITTCTDVNVADTCTTFGLTTAQLTATVLAAVNSFFVWWFPPNQK